MRSPPPVPSTRVPPPHWRRSVFQSRATGRGRFVARRPSLPSYSATWPGAATVQPPPGVPQAAMQSSCATAHRADWVERDALVSRPLFDALHLQRPSLDQLSLLQIVNTHFRFVYIPIHVCVPLHTLPLHSCEIMAGSWPALCSSVSPRTDVSLSRHLFSLVLLPTKWLPRLFKGPPGDPPWPRNCCKIHFFGVIWVFCFYDREARGAHMYCNRCHVANIAVATVRTGVLLCLPRVWAVAQLQCAPGDDGVLSLCYTVV